MADAPAVNIPAPAPQQSPGLGGDVAAGGPIPRSQRGRMSDFGQLATGEYNPPQTPILEHDPVAHTPFGSLGGQDGKSQALARAEPQGLEAELADIADAQGGESLDGEVLSGSAADAEMRAHYAELKAIVEADALGEPMRRKFVEAKIDGKRYRITVAEAVEGYQRQSDYTDKLRQLYAYKEQVDSRQRGLDNFITSLKAGGESFLRTMEYFGPDMFKGFAQAAQIYGEQLYAESQMDEPQRKVMAAHRAAQAKAHALEIRARQLEAELAAARQAAPQPMSRDQQYVFNQMTQMLPQAIEALSKQGIEWRDSTYSRSLFEEELSVLIADNPSEEVSTRMVYSALLGAHERLEADLRSQFITVPQPAAARTLPPVTHGQRGPVQAPPGVQNGARQQRSRIQDMGRTVGRR